MRDTIGRAVSLAFGLAALGKEQAEKVIDEMVKKGEMSREESKAWVDAVMSKGRQVEHEAERVGRERLSALLRASGMATREEVEQLKRRIEALEQALRPQQ